MARNRSQGPHVSICRNGVDISGATTVFLSSGTIASLSATNFILRRWYVEFAIVCMKFGSGF